VRAGDTAQSISTKAAHQSSQKAATPRAVSIWPASFDIPPSFVAASLYTAADKRLALAYKGAHAEVRREGHVYRQSYKMGVPDGPIKKGEATDAPGKKKGKSYWDTFSPAVLDATCIVLRLNTATCNRVSKFQTAVTRGRFSHAARIMKVIIGSWDFALISHLILRKPEV
jgi:hypothetical protein